MACSLTQTAKSIDIDRQVNFSWMCAPIAIVNFRKYIAGYAWLLAQLVCGIAQVHRLAPNATHVTTLMTYDAISICASCLVDFLLMHHVSVNLPALQMTLPGLATPQGALQGSFALKSRLSLAQAAFDT